MRISQIFLFVIFLLLLSSCSSKSIESFEGKGPELRIEDYFEGNVEAWGVVFDRSGDLIKEFKVDLRGERTANSLKLTEDFKYKSGKEEQRIWFIKKLDKHRYEGRAEDVFGVAEGRAYGNALHWQYDLNLELEDSERVRVHFDDWMYLEQDGVLVNRAIMSKFGFKLAEVVLFFQKK